MRAVVVLVATTLATAALAATPAMNAADSVKARQTHYKEIGASFKTIRDELAKPQVDKPNVVAAADTLATYAPQINGWFPRGSGSQVGLKTAARAEIWSDPKGFAEQVEGFTAQTRRFDAVARNGDVAEMKTALPALGGTCKSCHERFRVKDEH